MVLIDVVVAQRVDEFSHLQTANVRNHVGQERVGSDVEWHAEKRVSRALIELTVQHRGSSPTVREGSRTFHLELKDRVTRRQIDVLALTRVPAAHDQPAGKRIRFDLLDQARNLIDAVAFRIMATERSPEVTVDWAHVTRLPPKSARVLPVGPLFPDIDSLLAQVCFVRVPREKPKQLFSD